jgi:hypothetical protein
MPRTPPKRDNRWTQAKGKNFLEVLAATANVRAAFRAAGLTESIVYRRRKTDPEFRAGWEAALCDGYAKLEMALLERAIHGVHRPIVPKGTEVVLVHEYPDRLAIALLTLHGRTVHGTAPGTRWDPEEAKARLADKLATIAGE